MNGTLRRITASSPSILGGPRALLLQIAHPKVAQGVEDHSEFRSSPLPRLLATVQLLLSLLYGDEQEGNRAVERMHRRHRNVKGTMANHDSYSANNPELKCWVWATLVDTTEVLFQELVRPLGSEECALLYEDWLHLGARLGIPASAMPPDHASFRRYMDEMIGALTVSDVARDQAKFILERDFFSQAVPWPIRPFTRKFVAKQHGITVAVTTAMLPDSLREAYGLTALEDATWQRLRNGISRALAKRKSPDSLLQFYTRTRSKLRPLQNGVRWIRSRL